MDVKQLQAAIRKGTRTGINEAEAKALLKKFVTQNTLGLVTTHDLVLTELEKSMPTLKNIHLTEKWLCNGLGRKPENGR